MSAWAQLLRRLASFNGQLTPYWYMNNSAEFWFAVPSADSILENSFSQDIEFPFQFEDIDSIVIKAEVGSGSMKITNDLDGVEDSLESVEDFEIERRDGEIEISLKSNDWNKEFEND